MRQDRRRFVPRVNFITTPGYLDGPGARERAGLPASTGPYRVITQWGVFGFDEETCRMKLLALHPGITFEQAQAETSFELETEEFLETTSAPTEEELTCLHEIDPLGMVLAR
jgi:acyl CoA:acetate/3-ketoacid CoA transferase beta subunit